MHTHGCYCLFSKLFLLTYGYCTVTMQGVHFPIYVSDCKRCPCSDSLCCLFAESVRLCIQTDCLIITPRRPPGGQTVSCSISYCICMAFWVVISFIYILLTGKCDVHFVALISIYSTFMSNVFVKLLMALHICHKNLDNFLVGRYLKIQK